MQKFEGFERRIDKINGVLAQYGMKDLDEAKAICTEKGIDVESWLKVFNRLLLKMPFGLIL